MKTKDIIKIITNQYLKNISNITKEYTDTLHLLYRDADFEKENDLEGLFGNLEEKAGRYGSYLEDKENYLFHEEEVFLEAKRAKENYDTFR